MSLSNPLQGVLRQMTIRSIVIASLVSLSGTFGGLQRSKAQGGSPAPGGQLTITPGLPDPDAMGAYYARCTPQISISLSANTDASQSQPSAEAEGDHSKVKKIKPAVRLIVKGGATDLIRLNPPKAKAKKGSGSHTASDGSDSAGQPVATVTLAYDPSCAGQIVYVRMTGAGTLTAVDSAGTVHDGSQGLPLALDANATTSFSYQAPDASGTYQVIARFATVPTTLTFTVPDPQ